MTRRATFYTLPTDFLEFRYFSTGVILHRPKYISTKVFFSATICGVVLCALCSCRPFSGSLETDASLLNNGLLQTAQRTKDSIVVDCFKIRVGYEQRELLQALWLDGSTSEQVIPVDLRRRLANEGFRIGVQGRSLSPTIARLLEIDKIRIEESVGNFLDRTAERPSDQTEGTQMTQISINEMLMDKQVFHSVYTFQPGKRGEFKIYDEPLPEAHVFENVNGHLCGMTYPRAEGMIEISAIPYPDGSGVRFDVLPLFYYGDFKQTLKISKNYTMPETYRDKLVRNELKTSLKLLPGQWLIIGSTGESPPGLAKYFFTRDKGQTEQTVMILRLSAGSSNETFNAADLTMIQEKE